MKRSMTVDAIRSLTLGVVAQAQVEEVVITQRRQQPITDIHISFSAQTQTFTVGASLGAERCKTVDFEGFPNSPLTDAMRARPTSSCWSGSRSRSRSIR